jgi:DNA-binding NtrC family response regulator/pSer/pThr/pTyr-binding forkhead associated (FHA) protein
LSETQSTSTQAEPVPDSSNLRFRLLIYRDSSVRTFVLEGSRWVVGRAEDCEIRLDDVTVSRHHLVLERQGPGIRFHDLGGTNVTLLNGRPTREGPLELGATLLVGMTRLTLDTLRAQARVRVVQDPRQTAVIFRHYLDVGVRAPEVVDAEGERANFAAHTITRFLGELSAPPSELGNVEEAATTLLELALDQTGRQAGVIGTFEPGQTLKVLASIHRGPDGSDVCIPKQVLQEAMTRTAPVLLEPRTSAAATTAPSERIVVPLGTDPSGLLMLEGPLPGAPSGQAALHLAASLGALIWQRLSETKERSGLRQEISRLRFARSSASAAVMGSARLQPLRRKLSEAARHDLAVLLLGEEGTEKEDLARYLHAQSGNASGPFIAFHVGVLPPQRIEEVLLGLGRGHFDVQQDHATGCLLRAHGGTLFIDQPERMPPHVQQQLARILDRRAIELLGHEQPVPVSVRVVAASADPEQDEDAAPLEIHLAAIFDSGIRLHIPPLREHPDDIASIAEMILSEMGPSTDGAPRTLTDTAKRALLGYGWPGNTRQLHRALETAATRAGRQPIAPRHLPREIRDPTSTSSPRLPTLTEVERRHIVQTLTTVGGNKRQAAAVLGIATSTLYEKLRRHKFEM